jgi:DNA transformation protein
LGVAVSEQFNDFVLDLLGQVRRVTARRMFGGVGYYASERIFAHADDDTLYFKVDEQSRAAFVAEGMKPFQPMGPDTRPMAYYTVPARLFEDVDELRAWMDRAVTAGGTRKWKRSAR